jgi:hypothetical protein
MKAAFLSVAETGGIDVEPEIGTEKVLPAIPVGRPSETPSLGPRASSPESPPDLAFTAGDSKTTAQEEP